MVALGIAPLSMVGKEGWAVTYHAVDMRGDEPPMDLPSVFFEDHDAACEHVKRTLVATLPRDIEMQVAITLSVWVDAGLHWAGAPIAVLQGVLDEQGRPIFERIIQRDYLVAWGEAGIRKYHYDEPDPSAQARTNNVMNLPTGMAWLGPCDD